LRIQIAVSVVGNGRWPVIQECIISEVIKLVLQYGLPIKEFFIGTTAVCACIGSSNAGMNYKGLHYIVIHGDHMRFCKVGGSFTVNRN